MGIYTREGHGAMVREWSCAMRFQTPLDAEISEKYHVSPISILGHCFNVVSLGKALYTHMLYLTQVEMSNL